MLRDQYFTIKLNQLIQIITITLCTKLINMNMLLS